MDFVCHNQRVGSPKTSPFQVTVAYVESRLFMAEASGGGWKYPWFNMVSNDSDTMVFYPNIIP